LLFPWGREAEEKKERTAAKGFVRKPERRKREVFIS